MTSPTPEQPVPFPFIGIVCGVCMEQHNEGLTIEDAEAFLAAHAPHGGLGTVFRVEVPSALVGEGYVNRATDAWNLQANAEGFRAATGTPQILEPGGRVAIIEGYVVPIGTENQVPVTVPGDPVPGEFPPGGEPV